MVAGARRRLRRVAAGLVVAVLVAGCGGPGAAPWHGPVISPVGFGVTPAGRQSPLGDLPLASALSPDGRYLAVSNAGEGVQSLQLVDTASGAVVHTARYPAPAAVFVGLAFAPDGRTLYASGGGNNVIRRYAVGGGELSERPAIPLPTTDPAGQKINPYPAGIALTPDGRRLLVADQQADAISVVDLDTGAVHTTAAGHRPYGVVAAADGHQAYVTDQGADTVTVLDLTGPEPAVQKTLQVGTHPNRVIASADGRELFVADAESDEVSVIDTASSAVVRAIGLAPYPGAQVGSNPDGLALSGDGRTLYVANSGNNDVAVVDVAAGRVAGLIPTGWYPTSVAAGGHALFVTNGKGMGAGPNNGFRHPDPYERGTAADQYAGSMIVGTLSSIDLPPSAQQLADWTAQVGRNDGFDTHGEVHAPQGPAAGIVPRHPGEHSGPIQHVIYVVKENRTYDQVFGSLGKGDGDPSLNLFGEESAPNARALERAYTTFDNFYADAEVSAQGWNWTVAANSNPYSEQAWPSNQSKRGAPYPSESGDKAIAPNRDPAQAYIWDRLAAAHVSFRNYGMYIDLDAPDGPAHAVDPVLDANTDHDFKRYDLTCPDAADTFTPRATCGPARIAAWRAEFDRYVAG
ncbi:MAG: bifunctional YncE family protein/alkaline phosphatase family protein, partial [Pseudonocardia sp.]|nr:bifunctional YncE family protein/alkaline phosphatase family protein [Pseudonocardia sp.]